MEKEQLADIPIVYHEDGHVVVDGIPMSYLNSTIFLKDLSMAVTEAMKWIMENNKPVNR